MYNILKIKILYKKSFKNKKINHKKISHFKIYKKSDKYISIGEEFIKSGRYAVVILAGGLGTRLGFNGPKGTIKINNQSLFEIYIEKLKKVNKKYNITIPLYIMTSTSNNISTVNYFKCNNYFSYPQEHIKIFIQNNLPILNKSGKILKKNNSIMVGPNGNGDVFKSLKKNNLIVDMKLKNIEYVLFINVDNPLNNLVDFDFIGATIYNNYKLSSKTIKLTVPNEWIFVKYKKRPFMLPNYELNKKLFNKKVNNEYVYRYKNISYHLINTNLIEKFSRINLPYHRAYKKINNIETFKFEKFIFDAFYFTDDMMLYETNYSEFYPIKTIDDLNYLKKNNL